MENKEIKIEDVISKIKNNAANGVWNNAANPLIIPKRIKKVHCFLLNSTLPRFFPIAPPNWTATPSRPTLAPNPCANNVFKVNKIGKYQLIFFLSFIASSIKYFILILVVLAYLLLYFVNNKINGVK